MLLFEFFDLVFHFLVLGAAYNDIQNGRAGVSVTNIGCGNRGAPSIPEC
jgi:hypothetical protein